MWSALRIFAVADASSLAQSNTYRKINGLTENKEPIVINQRSSFRGTPCKSVNGKISRDLDYATL